jgi:hypothetical protein
MSTIKNGFATNLLKITTNLAKTSTVMSPMTLLSEPKLPKSLLKK